VCCLYDTLNYIKILLEHISLPCERNNEYVAYLKYYNGKSQNYQARSGFEPGFEDAVATH